MQDGHREINNLGKRGTEGTRKGLGKRWKRQRKRKEGVKRGARKGDTVSIAIPRQGRQTET